MVYFAVNNVRISKSTEMYHGIKPPCIIFSLLHRGEGERERGGEESAQGKLKE